MKQNWNMDALSDFETASIEQDFSRAAEARRIRDRIVGVTLRQRRLELSRSMDELAQSLGIGAEMVEAWELGDATPNANQMAVLTNALDMRLPALMQSPKAHAGAPAPERSRELEALRQRLAGGLLRCAREDNGASIGQLSAATGIDSEVLSAI